MCSSSVWHLRHMRNMRHDRNGCKVNTQTYIFQIFQQYFLEHWEHAARQEQVPAHEAHRELQEHLQRSLGNIRRQTDLL